MIKLQIREYMPVDFLDIEATKNEILERKGQPIEYWAKLHKVAGPTFTVIDPDSSIVFCCGVHRPWEGMGRLWAVFSTLSKKYPQTTVIKVKEMLEFFCDHYGYARLEAVIDPEWPEAIRLIEWLGFKRECLMKKYGTNGRDKYLYALLRN